MAKRITSSAVNWTFITETLKKADLQKALPLKMQHEKYFREMASAPAELPKIDWSFYKSRIGAAGMVDSFQKAYEGLKIPYPTDQGELSKVESSNEAMKNKAKKQYADLLVTMEESKKKLAELDKVMCYADMTVEEFFLARPDYAISSEKPKIWPQFHPDLHKPAEEQPKEEDGH